MLKKFKAFILMAVIISVAMCAVCVYADPADSTTPRVYTQPDGTSVEVYTYGDEWYNFQGDSEGYLFEKDEGGYFNYVTTDTDTNAAPALSADGSLVRPANAVKGFDLAPQPSEIYKGDESPDDEDEDLLNEQIDMSPELASEDTVSNVTSPKKAVSFAKTAYGDRKLLVVVVDFNDCETDLSVHTPQSMTDYFFSTEEGVVSVSNFFTDQSGGRFTYVPAFKMSEVASSAEDGKPFTDADLTDGIGAISDGFMKIKVGVNHPNDGANENFVAPAMTLLDEYIDFSQFDTSGNGRISPKELTVFFWVSGYNDSVGIGSSTGGKSYWANCFLEKTTCDDVLLFYYKEEPYASAGVMHDENEFLCHGTIVHELGHTLDLPDYYDSPNYGYVNIMSLMGAGSKGRVSLDGKIGGLPASFDAWTTLYLGWYSDDDLLILDASDEGTYGLVSRYSTQKSDPSKGIYRFIKINTSADSKEYYIIENRLFKGYDIGIQYWSPYVAEEGIAVWRIDESRFNTTHPIYTDPNGYLDCGIRFMANGMRITGANSSTNALTIQSFNKLYDTKKPLWSKVNNRFSFLGKQSYPNTAYTTLPDGVTDTDSGVAMKFLSDAGDDVAMVKIGENDIEELVYTSSGSTKMYVFNNTDIDTSTIPFIAEYTGDSLSNLVSYGRIPLTAGSYATTSSEALSFDSSKKYSTLFIDLPSLKTYYTEPVQEEEFLPDVEQTLSFSLDTSGALSNLATDAAAMLDSKIKFVKPIPASGNTIVYYNNQIEITDGIEDMGTYVALPVTNKGENTFVAVEYNGTSPVKKSVEIVVTGEKLVSVSKDSSTTSTTWPAETVYAGYLAEDSGATAEQIATAQKLYGYVDGAATRIPSQGTSSASSAITVDFTTVDYGYYNLDLYINGTLSSATPWFLRFGNNYWRVRSTDNHILLDSTDTGVALAADEWQSVLLMLDGTDVDIYINGILAGKGCVDFNVTSIKMWEGSTKPANEANLYEDRASFERGTKNIE